MIAKCPVCGKETEILHAEMWAYKRRGTYFCSWGCLRAKEGTKKMNGMAKQDVDDCKIIAMAHPDLGEFYYDRRNRTMDWRLKSGEEVTASPEKWHLLIGKLPGIMQKLGI